MRIRFCVRDARRACARALAFRRGVFVGRRKEFNRIRMEVGVFGAGTSEQ